jgi:hypothetical protein
VSAAQLLFPQPLPVNILPFLWAVGDKLPAENETGQPPRAIPPDIAVYRRYTEAILRRYTVMSLEAGRVPSLLGRELFRGKVTNYRVSGFDDVVIFVHDVSQCLSRIATEHREIIERLALQQHSLEETSELLSIHRSSIVRRYMIALDLLSQVFLDAGMMECLKSCQEVEM